jgi:hypothetical protein
MNTKKWQAKRIKHNSVDRIAVYFENSKELISRIKTIEGAQWSQQNKVWHLPDTEVSSKPYHFVSQKRFWVDVRFIVHILVHLH